MRITYYRGESFDSNKSVKVNGVTRQNFVISGDISATDS